MVNLLALEMSNKKNRVIGRRLRHLRKSLGYEYANTFARSLGIQDNRWTNLENGFPLSKEIAFLLVRKVSGLSLDWLYYGRTDGLSERLGQRLGEFPVEVPTPSRRNDNTV
jgi:transcriptional regulator with XRE-family HTH domain